MRNSGSSIGSFMLGGIMGAMLMFILDPDQGRGRRAFARQKIGRGVRMVGRKAEDNAKHVWNRMHGVVAETKSRIPGKQEIRERVERAANRMKGQQRAGA